MRSKIAYYVDEHIGTAVVSGIVLRGVDLLTVKQAGLLGAPDAEQLAFALNQQRGLVTKDDDFVKIHASGVEHAGVVLVPERMPVGETIKGFMLIYQVLEPEDMICQVEYL